MEDDGSASAGGSAQQGIVETSRGMVEIRARIRAFAESEGFGLADVTRIVTASSELMRNLIEYAEGGRVSWTVITGSKRRGVELVFEDDGPGIEDVEEALTPGTGSGRGLGQGLPGTMRLMDEMEIESNERSGTRVTVRKWLPDSR